MELRLHFSFESALLSESSQCLTLKTVIDKLVRVYEYAHWQPYIKRIVPKVEPFIPTDCSHESLWPMLNDCNSSIYHCLGLIAHRV